MSIDSGLYIIGGNRLEAIDYCVNHGLSEHRVVDDCYKLKFITPEDTVKFVGAWADRADYSLMEAYIRGKGALVEYED